MEQNILKIYWLNVYCDTTDKTKYLKIINKFNLMYSDAWFVRNVSKIS